MMKTPNEYRITNEFLPSTDKDGNNGMFRIPLRGCARPIKELLIIASDGMGWEHVSVSLPDRTPTWEEMCYVKSLFWDDEDCVIQYHPPKSEYVNNHDHCLHLWKCKHSKIPMPDSILVGIK